MSFYVTAAGPVSFGLGAQFGLFNPEVSFEPQSDGVGTTVTLAATDPDGIVRAGVYLGSVLGQSSNSHYGLFGQVLPSVSEKVKIGPYLGCGWERSGGGLVFSQTAMLKSEFALTEMSILEVGAGFSHANGHYSPAVGLSFGFTFA